MMTPSWQTQNSSEQARAWRTPVLEDLEVLHATYLTHSFPRHVHEEYCLGVVTGGAERVQYRGVTYHAPAGSIVVLQPGEAHSNWAANDDGWSFQVCYPSLALFEEISQRQPFFEQPVFQDVTLFKALCNFHQRLENADSANPLASETALLQILHRLAVGHSQRFASEHTDSAQEPKAIRQTKDYLHTHYAQKPSLQQLARLTGLSPYYLSRIFHKTVGLPPHAYLTHVRIAQAKQLLAGGQAIAQVAAETGFTDQSHFTKTFKAIVGVTPGQYQ